MSSDQLGLSLAGMKRARSPVPQHETKSLPSSPSTSGRMSPSPRPLASQLRVHSSGGILRAAEVTSRARRLGEAARSLFDAAEPPRHSSQPDDTSKSITATSALADAQKPTVSSTSPLPPRSVPPPSARAAARARISAAAAATAAGLLEPPRLRAMFESVRHVFIAGAGTGRQALPLPIVAEAVRRGSFHGKSHTTDGGSLSCDLCSLRRSARSASAPSSPPVQESLRGT